MRTSTIRAQWPRLSLKIHRESFLWYFLIFSCYLCLNVIKMKIQVSAEEWFKVRNSTQLTVDIEIVRCYWGHLLMNPNYAVVATPNDVETIRRHSLFLAYFDKVSSWWELVFGKEYLHYSNEDCCERNEGLQVVYSPCAFNEVVWLLYRRVMRDSSQVRHLGYCHR